MNSEDRIGEIAALIARLRPVPTAWIRAAEALPYAGRAFEPGGVGPHALQVPRPGASVARTQEIDGGVSRAR
jgi:hypothetical protein